METIEDRLNRFMETASERQKGNPFARTEPPQVARCPKCNEAWVAERSGWATCQSCRRASTVKHFERICPSEYAATDEFLLPADEWKEVREWRPEGRGLLLLGPSRTSKTRSAWMLIKRLSEQGVKVTAFSPIGFGSQLVDAQMRGEGMQFLERISKAELVFFDDLGKGKLTENVEACLFEIFELRTSWRRSTIATTNDTGESLKDRMTENRGEPFVARLREFFDVVDFAKKDQER